MDHLRRRYWLLPELAATALFALLGAFVVTTLYEGQLARVRVIARRAPRVAASAAPVYAKAIQAIVERNIFCSACRERPALGPPLLGPTTLPLRLLAVMYAPPPWDRRWSVAIIRDRETGASGPYVVGAIVRGATVGAIEGTRVTLVLGGDRRELLDLLDGPDPGPARPERPPAAIDAAIARTGEHSYVVRRAMVDELLANAGALASLARVAPELRDGRPVGFRLAALRPDGLLARLGLQNGDVVTALNGLEMTGVERALEAYTKLKTASHLSVALDRTGRRITQDYTVQ
jgi:general secretion pathway protein C